MPNHLITLLLLLFLAIPARSQEDNAAPGAAEDSVEETQADEAADDEEEIDDADLDVQTYEEDDDDFVPTEEIPADEPIPFPSNI
jgi:hypothetical protein